MNTIPLANYLHLAAQVTHYNCQFCRENFPYTVHVYVVAMATRYACVLRAAPYHQRHKQHFPSSPASTSGGNARGNNAVGMTLSPYNKYIIS
jgi:hypothetical protein